MRGREGVVMDERKKSMSSGGREDQKCRWMGRKEEIEIREIMIWH